MKILVLNCGSSSIKYQLFNMVSTEVLAKGIVEKIGLKGSFLKLEKTNGDKVMLEGEILDHQTGIEYLLGVLISKNHGCISSLNEIQAVGHRVAHGGEKFEKSEFITKEVKAEINWLCQLAPLHNPAHIKGIEAMEGLLPNVPQVAVFDTAFHQTIPDYAYMYAIPYSLYKKYSIRRYGFHGTSHKYVAQKACESLGIDFNKQRIITCHLGNGASVTAIKDGKSVDTSMGLTPVEGLIMGTRAGDLDLGVLTFIQDKEEVPYSIANTIVNKFSGMLGVTGVSSDMREIEAAAESGNERAELGLNMYRYRLIKYIGSYMAALQGLDLLIFTGGIGENDPLTREIVCKNFEYAGIDFDEEINKGKRGKEVLLTKPGSKTKVMVVPTNEELVIATDTMQIVSEMNKN
ncbi:MAG: acetate kinase [Bacteroidales bacterium]|nr:acetate kinase [Bacteroidales bacterium]MCF8457415.1 acetate kinase [Bacteroidales bacterium]